LAAVPSSPMLADCAPMRQIGAMPATINVENLAERQ
jgi:hypothetical protein